MFQTLPPDLLAHILQLALGPAEQKYVGGGRHASGLPLVLGTDSRGLCGLRLVCKAFRDGLSEIPLHISVSTAHHVRILARALWGWNIATVQLNLAAEAKPDSLMHAASALPDKERRKIVAVGLSGMSVGFYVHGLKQRQLEGVCQMVIHQTTACSLGSLDRLSNIERLELRDLSVDDAKLLALLPKLPSLHSLHFGRFNRQGAACCYLPFGVVAQCPALRVLELGHNVSLTSPRTTEEALRELEESGLDMFKVFCLEVNFRLVWEAKSSPTCGLWVSDIAESTRLSKHFSCTLEGAEAGADGRCLVLRRRCVKDAIKRQIAACKGGSLVLGCDLSRQLVASPELQALIREAGLPVELHFNHLYEDLNIDDWFRLDVPVLACHWHTEYPGSWWFLLHGAWPCQGVAAIHGLTIPCEVDIAVSKFAASFCNLRTISTSGQGRLVEALPQSCERVEMRWTGLDSMGQTAGLGMYTSITRLSLQGFRMTELPPSVEHLDLRVCDVDGLVLLVERQLSSLRLENCNPGHRGATFAQQSGRAPINLLDWLAAAQPHAAVHVSDAQLTLGTLSMERYARKLSEAATHSLDIQTCTLHRRDGCLSMHSVADMARYMGRHFGRRVAVTCPASKNSCHIVRVDEGQGNSVLL